jgi:hypothetical protein
VVFTNVLILSLPPATEQRFNELLLHTTDIAILLEDFNELDWDFVGSMWTYLETLANIFTSKGPQLSSLKIKLDLCDTDSIRYEDAAEALREYMAEITELGDPSASLAGLTLVEHVHGIETRLYSCTPVDIYDDGVPEYDICHNIAWFGEWRFAARMPSETGRRSIT